MPFLVSGHGSRRPGGLFLVDGAVEQIDDLSTTGLAVAGGRLARLLRPSAEGAGGAELLVYDRHGVVEYRRLDDVADPHDVAPAPGGGWLVTSSVDNRVAHLDDAGRLRTVWCPSTVPDSWHPNCLAVVGDEVWVTAFGSFGTTRGWTEPDAAGRGFLRNLRTGEQHDGLSQPHSPRLGPDGWWVCDSARGRLVRRTGSGWDQVVALEGYPRGLALTADGAYVGESAPRGGTGANATLAVVESGSVTARLEVGCQEIYDVVEVPDALVAGVTAGFARNFERVASRATVATLDAVGAVDGTGRLGLPLDPAGTSTRLSARLPASMRAGERVPVALTLVNTGRTVLASVPPHPVFVGVQWRRDGAVAAEGARLRLPGAVLPGDDVSIEVELVAPASPGTYELLLSPVQEAVAWFADLDAANALSSSVEVVGGAGPAG